MDVSDQMTHLQQQQAKLEKKVEAAKNWRDYVRPASDYTDAEKVTAFDELHAQAEGIIRELINQGWVDDDSDHYLYEAAMEKTLGKEVWRLYRILQS